jgi:hypothetical protein
MYFLAPTLDSTHTISEDLHEIGVDDHFIHIVSKDEAGLKQEHLHSSNYIETRDFIRTGFIGANFGFIAGVIGAGLLMLTEPFGPDVIVPKYVYFIIVGFATLFGAWVGGLHGVAKENAKLSRFHDDIEKGKYLFLIYAKKGYGEKIKAMMAQKHPESEHVATDQQYLNPFSVVRRKRPVTT